MLAKQSWCLIYYPDSLLAKSLKAKYCPNSDFMHARLENLLLYTWRSLWSAKWLLEKGMGWRVGSGTQIQIWNDAWVPCSVDYKIQNPGSTFHQDNIVRILCIPLPLEKELDKFIWRREASGVYTVRSGYKKLIQSKISTNIQQNQISYKPMYNELWKENLQTKIIILVWKTLNNFLPTFSNLLQRKI